MTAALPLKGLCAWLFLLCALTMLATMRLQSMNGASGVTEMQIVTNFKSEVQAFLSDASLC